MPGEDQERFEDYLELERFIAELQAGHVAHPPQDLTPRQARVYRMAMLFHAVTPGVGEPDPEFVAQLQPRLEKEFQASLDQPIHTQDTRPMPLIPAPKRRVSRRLLLAGSVAAAASVAIGAGTEHMVEQVMQRNAVTQNDADQGITVRVASPTEWFYVTTLAEMGNQAVKFKAEGPNGSLCLTGYVVRSDGTTGDPTAQGKIIAMSAACTHKGCIVQWSGSDRSFHCPCHGGVFSQDGGIDTSSSSLYLKALPLLDVRLDDAGKIYVRMPVSI